MSEAGQQTAPAEPNALAGAAPPEVNPARQRASRLDTTKIRRRRRSNGNLNRMTQYKLDCIPEEALDLKNYVYRWVNDEAGRLRAATRMDDYDFVQTHELEGGGFDTEGQTDSESTDRVRMLAGTDKQGHPVYTYLVRKPRAFHEADYEEIVEAREDMMEGRVKRAEDLEDPVEAVAEELPEMAYVPKGTGKIGHAGGRRRGPIPRGKKA
jgi:hypothetical protein